MLNKTILQIASEIGVSKQAIWQKIKREPLASALKNMTQKIGNTLYVNPDGVDLIKNNFYKVISTKSSIDTNSQQENINKTSSDTINHHQDTSIDTSKCQQHVNKVKSEVDNHKSKASVDINYKLEDENKTSIVVNKSEDNINKTSTDKMIEALMMQLEIANKQNENLSDELSKERAHSRELADKLAEIASNAQKLHAGDIVTPRLNVNDAEINTVNKRKKNNIFGWLRRKAKQDD